MRAAEETPAVAVRASTRPPSSSLIARRRAISLSRALVVVVVALKTN
jgi:hypothetical protein